MYSLLQIMTTNHPEKLDSALIRPGRIDKKLILGFMQPDDIVRMLEVSLSQDLYSVLETVYMTNARFGFIRHIALLSGGIRWYAEGSRP